MSDEEQTVAPSDSAIKALRAAVQEAARLHHRSVTLDHLFHVLLREDSVTRVLSLCGCDTQHLRAEMAEYLELLPAPSGRAGLWTKNPKPDTVFANALQKAILQALGSGQSEFGTDGLLVVVWDAKDTYASMLLRAEGLMRVELLRCISHGSPALPPLSPQEAQPPSAPPASSPSSPLSPSPGGALAALVLHNDHYTAMDFVVQVLTQVFGLTEKQASVMMMQVHKAGHAALGPYPVDVAQRLAEEIRSLAAAEEFPLLCTIEPVC